MRVARILKFVLAGMALLLIVLIVGAAVVLQFIDFNHYKPLIAEEVKKATGRDLAISGDVKLAISLTPGVAVEGLTLSNAEWGSRPHMVSARRLEAHVALTSLIFGDLEIKRIELTGADIMLETDPHGRANFEFEPPEGGGEGRRPPGQPGADIGAIQLVDKAVIRDSRLTYINGATGATYSTVVELLTLQSDGPDEPIDLVYAGDYNDAPIRANARLGTFADLLEPGEPWPVDLTIEAGGAAVTVNGTIAEPLTAVGLDLAIEARGKQLGDLSKLAGAEVPTQGAYSLSGQVTGDATDVIEFAELKAQLGTSDLSGDVSVRLVGEQQGIEANLASDKIDLATLGTGIDAPLQDAATALSLKDGTLEIESFSANLAGAAITLKGTIAEPFAGRGLDLAVSLSGDQAGDISKMVGVEVPALGAYSLSTQVTGDTAGAISLAALKGRLGASKFSGKVSVDLSGRNPVFNASLACDTFDLAALDVGVAVTVRNATAAFSVKGGRLDVGSLKANLSGATVEVKGVITDATRMKGLNLAVVARGDRFGDLSQLAGGKLPALGPYSLSLRVTGDAATAIDLTGLAANLGDSDISGSAKVILSGKQAGVEASLASDKIDLAALGAGNAPLRNTVAVLSLRDKKLLIESIEANLSGATVLAKGTISEPTKAAGLDLTITAEGEQFGDLSALVGREMPALGKYAISTRVTGDATATIRTSAITAQVGESDLAGEATLTLTAPRPSIDVTLSSKRIDLPVLGGVAAGDADVAGQQQAAKKPDRIFSDDPLSLEWLKAVNVNLRFDAATVTGRGPDRRNALVVLSLRDGLLDVESLKVEFDNGVLDSAVQIDGRTETAGLVAKMTLRKVDMAILLAQTTRAGLVEGQVNLEFDVTGQGNSVRRIMASLDGRASLAMGKGRIRSRTLQTWVGGPTQILSNALTLNVGGYTVINCVLGVFDIEKGVATTSGFLFDTDVAAFVGDGTVNLGTEALDLIISPQVKKMTLSVAVPVRIRGTLANPQYSSDSAAVRRKVGGVLAGLVYPPALIIGLGELGTFGAGDCAAQTGSTGGQTTPEQAEPTTEQQPSNLPGRLLKGTGDTITRGLEGLFGR